MIIKEKYTVKQLRALKNMTRNELSETTGLSYNTIQSYENDVMNLRKASYENLELIANALGVSTDDIFLNANSD